MKAAELIRQLSGGDLRSLGKSGSLLKKIRDQEDFDELLKLLFQADKAVVMRAADMAEKLSLDHPEYLQKHKKQLFSLLDTDQKELKWHLALLMPRLKLNENEAGILWECLYHWASDKNESRIARVHSLQGLSEILRSYPLLREDYNQLLISVEAEQIPSLSARIRIIRKKYPGI